jgi:N-acetylneuraminic acid mutarotase
LGLFAATLAMIGTAGMVIPRTPIAAQTGMPEPPPGSIWTVRAELPDSFSEIAVAEVDGKIYVIGGYPQTRRYVDTVQVYDSAANSWSRTTPVPQPLHHTMAAGLGGKLYVIGGEVSDTGFANQGYFLDTVYEYDPATAGWAQKAAMPTARSAGTVGVIDGKIYVAGGRPPRGHDFAVYDPSADAWTVLPDLPTQRNHLASGVLGGKLYVTGGRFGGGVGSEMTDQVEVYDPATNTWSTAAPMLRPRAGHNGIVVHGCFYAFGGEGNDEHPLGLFPDNDIYHPVTDTWQRLEPIPVAVHGVTGAASLNGWIHLPGGGISRGGNSGATIHQVFRPEVACQ